MRRNPRRMLPVLMGGGGPGISLPDSVFNFLPFYIKDDGDGTFSIDPNFVLRTHAGVAVSKTYYVKPEADGGSDAANGLTEATAFASINRALSRSDVDRVMVKAGIYGTTVYPASHSWTNNSPARSIEVIGYGGQVISTSAIEFASLTWTAVGNHYEASYAVAVYGVWDAKTPDANDDYVPLTLGANVADVDGNPGKWFYDAVADVIYVRTSDSRAPDIDIFCFISIGNGRMDDAVTYYIEGIDFYGGSNAFLLSTTAACKLYFKDCEFKYTGGTAFAITGGAEIITENCLASRSIGGDAIHFEVSGGIQTANAILINTIGRYAGEAGDTVINGYSRHGPGYTITINCEFHHNYGPNIASIADGTKEWHIGVNCHDQLANNYNYSYDNESITWLETCISADAPVADLFAYAATTKIYYRNMTPATPTTGGAGTIATY